MTEQPDHGPAHIKRPEDLLPQVGKRITVHICEGPCVTQQRFEVLTVDPENETVAIKQVSGTREEHELPFANLGLRPADDSHWWRNWIEADLT
ncbi:hypothetical protein KJ910_00005 [Patescibacteria group bacterium]|nr:hypothetical protein [Patescibacteria group bacterium]MBU1907471.1 hypothetical protein [Patescibacteria group bacterium]